MKFNTEWLKFNIMHVTIKDVKIARYHHLSRRYSFMYEYKHTPGWGRGGGLHPDIFVLFVLFYFTNAIYKIGKTSISRTFYSCAAYAVDQ